MKEKDTQWKSRNKYLSSLLFCLRMYYTWLERVEDGKKDAPLWSLAVSRQTADQGKPQTQISWGSIYHNVPKFSDRQFWANRADPDQTAPIFWMHYSKEKPSCSTFWMITANFRVSEILGFLRYTVSIQSASFGHYTLGPLLPSERTAKSRIRLGGQMPRLIQDFH